MGKLRSTIDNRPAAAGTLGAEVEVLCTVSLAVYVRIYIRGHQYSYSYMSPL